MTTDDDHEKAGAGRTDHRGGAVRFARTELTPAELALQAEVRAFLAAEPGDPRRRPGLGMNGAASREFLEEAGR